MRSVIQLDSLSMGMTMATLPLAIGVSWEIAADSVLLN